MSFAWLWWQQATQSGWCNDESAHIPAGLYHWQTGQMDAYRVNPPLPRMIATLPLLIDGPKLDWFSYNSLFARSEYQFAHQWIKDNPEDVPQYLLRCRLMMLPFVALGLWTIVSWTRRLYGHAASWLAGLLWAFNPDVITFGSVVAPDLPAASAGLLCGYCFWNWLIQRERPFPWSVAACVALAILCKFSWLFLLLALPLITLVYDFRRRAFQQREATDRPTRCMRDPIRLSLSFVLTILIINWAYGFDGTGRLLGNYQFVSEALSGHPVQDRTTGNRFTETSLAWIPVPLPAEMLQGLDYLKFEFERGFPCYLRGEWQQGGWWYFHLYAMAVKLPLGTLCLIAVGFVTLLVDCFRKRQLATGEWFPLLIAAAFVGLVSSQTGFTHHVRYVLPAYGFLFIVASRVANRFPIRISVPLAAACLLGTMVFHITHPGLSHTHFNIAVGGPNHGWRHLSHSNVDWGQSTYRMIDWIKQHPEHRPITVLFRSSLGQPELLVSDIQGVRTQIGWHRDEAGEQVPDQAGWYLLSSFRMPQDANRYFRNREVEARPAPDMLLFKCPSQGYR